MDPSKVIEMVQATCRRSNDILAARPKKTEMTSKQIVQQLKSPKKSHTRTLLSYILPHCRTAVQRREATKSGIIAYFHEIRKAYIHLANLLVKDGILPDSQLIFYLDRAELADLISKPAIDNAVNKPVLVWKAQRRMRLFPQWSEYRFDEFNTGVVHPTNDDDRDLTGVNLVVGTSVSEGSVTGRACVITSIAEISRIRSGDILVTLSTDIGWSTYFPILGGVVTELGGLISHGEYQTIVCLYDL